MRLHFQSISGSISGRNLASGRIRLLKLLYELVHSTFQVVWSVFESPGPNQRCALQESIELFLKLGQHAVVWIRIYDDKYTVDRSRGAINE